MLKLILRRVLVAIPTLILVSMIVFMLQKILPGDPVLTLAGEERDPAVLDYLRDKYRLNDPLPMQYAAWAGQVLQGDLGKSLRTDVPVTTLIGQKLPVTLQLAAMAMLFALLVGIPMGIVAAVRKGQARRDGRQHRGAVGHVHSQLLAGHHPHHGGVGAVEAAAGLGLCVAGRGFLAVDQDHADAGAGAVHGHRRLPDAAHALGHAGSAVGRLRAHGPRQGVPARSVVLRHALRNALMPIVTLVTLLFGELLAGAVLTEQVFTIPGFGKLVVDAVFTRDYAVVQGVVLCVAVGFILMNLLADILYILVNPA